MPIPSRLTTIRSAAVFIAMTLLLTACVVRLPAPAPPPAAAYPVGTSLHLLEVDGVQREYRVYVPSSVGDGPTALVVMLHGGFGSAEQAERSYNWNNQAEQRGIVIVYPEGLDRSWNAGGCCGQAMKRNVDDVDFISAVVAEVESGIKIDRDRVFATGMSNGGIMAYRLACETELFAAIAPVAATMLVDCDQANPVSVLHIHGAEDGSVPLDGSVGGGSQNVDGPPLADVAAFWRDVNECEAVTVDTYRDDSRVQLESASGCVDGTAVDFIVVAGAGHQWPGSDPSAIGEALGADPPSQLLDATSEIAEFFASHPRAG